MKFRPVFLLVGILSLAACRSPLPPDGKTGPTAPAPATIPALSSPPTIIATRPPTPLPAPSRTPSLAIFPSPQLRFSPPVTWQYRGAAVTGYWNDSYSTPGAQALVDHLKAAGVNTIQLLVAWFQPDMRSSTIAPDAEGQSPRDAGVVDMIRYIHAQGLGVMLKPHAEPVLAWDGVSEGWRGVIDPADRAAWFASYDAFILHYARIAAAENVELLCVGSEMMSMTRSEWDQRRWIDLVDRVRKLYAGKILYGATWFEVAGGAYEDRGPDGQVAFSATFQPLPANFWSHFDYAGLGAYFNLYTPHKLFVPDPGVETLIDGWYHNDLTDRSPEEANLFAAISRWQQQIDKPVIFVEVGYENVDFAGYADYEYDPVQVGDEDVPALPNDAAQANLYRATFTAWGGVPWLAGAFWWQFNPDEPTDANCGDSPASGDQVGYSPCGRPAMQVLSNWYR